MVLVSVAFIKARLLEAYETAATEKLAVQIDYMRDGVEAVQGVAAGSNSHLLHQNLDVLLAQMKVLDETHEAICDAWQGVVEYAELL